MTTNTESKALQAWTRSVRATPRMVRAAWTDKQIGALVQRAPLTAAGSFAGLDPLDHAETEALIALIGGTE